MRPAGARVIGLVLWSGKEGSESGGGRHAILVRVCFAWRGGFRSVPSGSEPTGGVNLIS